jgi:DNA-binding transcriptional ArsR family regulator
MPTSHAHSGAFREVLRCFAVFAEPMRVVIFQRLARRPSSAGELARELPVSRVAVVQHIKRLEAAGLVRGWRDGRRRRYCIEPLGLKRLSGWIESLQQAPGADQARSSWGRSKGSKR